MPATCQPFKMPSVQHLVKYYKKYHGDWYRDTIEMVMEEEGLNAEEAAETANDTVFAEARDQLKKTIELILAGKPIFRVIGVDNAAELIENVKNGKADEYGEHWTTDIQTARILGETLVDRRQEKIILEAIVNAGCIDVEESFCLWDMYPDESEINIIEDSCECDLKIVAVHFKGKRIEI